MLTVKPSTFPGSILPSVILDDGTAVYDQLGKWFTLIVMDDIDTTEIEDAADSIGMPLAVLRLRHPVARGIYATPLVLVRPDHHVAWRGHSLPSSPEQGRWRMGQPVRSCLDLLNLVRGA